MMNKKIQLSGVVIASNNEKVIEDCLHSLKFCDETILVDTGITDGTLDVAEKTGAIVVECKKGSFQTWRNCGLEAAKGDWILYVDTDERITKELEKEIKSKIKNPNSNIVYYAIPRNNFILGSRFKYSGEYPDYQKRLFRKSKLKKWTGDLHEEPIVDGEIDHLENAMTHLKHDNFRDMVSKTNTWSEKEAKLLFDSNHPQMAPWRFFRIMITEFFDWFIRKRAFMDGYKGVMYGIYQIWSKTLTYAKLWEMQIKQQ
ncbi:glycosyltransferase family 2 protein [Patescibacteria group bacterium]